jgi:arylsulfatase A-like enzyme
MTARGIAFIERAAKAGRPFYLQLSHYPNQGEKARRRDGGEDTAVVDATVAELLAALDRLGLARSTYVIYTSDHGAPGRGANEPLSGGKGAVSEGGLRVPFLVRGPGVPAGACVHTPVTAMDVLPTLGELAGLKDSLPRGVEGGSLAALLRAPAAAARVPRAREELVFHFPHYDLGNGGPATALIRGDWKLVKNYEAGTLRLFDLARDPAEDRDLARGNAGLVKELDTRLAQYLEEVGAQLPRPNPNYDPQAPRQEETPPRRGGKGGKNRHD